MKLSKKVNAMNTLISVFHRTIVPVVLVLTLFIAGAKSQTSTPALSVSPAKFIVAAAKSTGDFQIISSISWKDSSSQSWLTVNKNSGSDIGTIFFTAQQNADSTARIGKIIVSATGADSQTVTITQLGSSGYTIPPMPSYSSLMSDTLLPDPFTFIDGSRMNDPSLWPSRRAEIAVLAQEFEYGYK